MTFLSATRPLSLAEQHEIARRVAIILEVLRGVTNPADWFQPYTTEPGGTKWVLDCANNWALSFGQNDKLLEVGLRHSYIPDLELGLAYVLSYRLKDFFLPLESPQLTHPNK